MQIASILKRISANSYNFIKQFIELKFILFNIVFLSIIYNGNAQPPEPAATLPPGYYLLRTDTSRMRFLMNAISDSLNVGQLKSIYIMARQGLSIAEKNNVDTMKGIFCFDIAKAFSYEIAEPDSAIFYYKKVLPYFPDKMSYYNLVSVREIMQRYLQQGNKNLVFAYLDSLHDRIDTMAISNPRRFGISSVMATVYQYYGMFKTAISLYVNSIEGMRQAGLPRSVGLPMANLAELYDESEDDTNAIRYAREALGYLGNMEFMGTAANLASYYTNLEQTDSARYFNKLADSVGAKIHNDMQLHVRGPFNDVDILCSEKKYAEARKVLAGVKPWIAKNDDKSYLPRYFISSASIDTAFHQWANAKDTLMLALAAAKKNGQEISVVIALQELSTVFTKLHNFQEAYRYQQEYMQHKDSMSSDETKSRLADFEAMYKTSQKEESIALLEKTNDIKDLRLKNSKQENALYLGASAFLLAATGTYFYQRNRRQKIQSQKSKAELQMQVFRAQMNPHFIFNSLTGVEYFILQNDKRKASAYLNKFASLIRIILSNSRKDVVLFADDLKTIKLYVDLELLRFNHNFCYITDVDESLMENDYKVPPLLIQPFVENAILHGFSSSQEKNLRLKISALRKGDYVIYMIEDNGIGRKESAANNALNKRNHQSLGLQITQQRIDLFNEQHKGESSVNIEDLYDEFLHPAGTKVTVKIKMI